MAQNQEVISSNANEGGDVTVLGLTKVSALTSRVAQNVAASPSCTSKEVDFKGHDRFLNNAISEKLGPRRMFHAYGARPAREMVREARQDAS